MASKSQQTSSLDNLKALLDERAELWASIKRMEERAKELDEVIRPVLADRGPQVHNGYQFEVKTTAGRKTVDYKAMAEDYNIDMEPYSKVGAPSTRFEIKRVNEI
jgi:hypothetical protein